MINLFLSEASPEKGGMDVFNSVLAGAANVICNIIFNKRYHPNDPELLELFRLNKDLLDMDGIEMFLVEMLPEWLSPLLFPKALKKLINKTENFKDFIIQKIKEHIETFTPDQPRDFLDAYIKERGV